MSGFIRPEPSAVTGPRLLNKARLPSESTAPTEKTASYSAGGAFTVSHDGPSFPAEATTKIPAARRASAAGRRASASQPSIGGHPHELLRTCGALVGSPSANASPL